MSFLIDAQYLGEKIPFYQKKIDPETDAQKKESDFFPEKLNIMSRSPKWKISKPLAFDSKRFEAREEFQNEKINKLKQSWENRKIKFIDDVALSYFNIKGGLRCSFKYNKVI